MVTIIVILTTGILPCLLLLLLCLLVLFLLLLVFLISCYSYYCDDEHFSIAIMATIAVYIMYCIHMYCVIQPIQQVGSGARTKSDALGHVTLAGLGTSGA